MQLQRGSLPLLQDSRQWGLARRPGRLHTRSCRTCRCRASVALGPEDGDERQEQASTSGRQPSSSAEVEAFREQLSRQLAPPQELTGEELHRLLLEKWGRSYDTRLQRRGSRMRLEVMWKHLEQKSFPASREQYALQLEAVAAYVTAWGRGDAVRQGIRNANRRGPGFTGGGGARAVCIDLDVDLDRLNESGEWD